MKADLYTKQILELCADVPRLGNLPDAHGSATLHSKLCGATITVDVKLEDGRVSAYAHEVEADALGKAAASYLARYVVGKTPKELKALQQTMHLMFELHGPPPAGEWAGLKIFESVRGYPGRHASVLLPFDTVVAAVEAALKNDEAAPAKAGVQT